MSAKRSSILKPEFKLRASALGTEYWIFAGGAAAASAGASPTSGGARPVPAVLFLDGDDQFPLALEAYGQLRAAHAIPPLALFGVGYGASYSKPENERGRDYTPTRHGDEPRSGGAEAFVAFLVDELWPELTRRYALREDMRGLAGHSLGSLLALHALLRPRPFFNRILASAPSLWWDDRALLCAAGNLQRTGVAIPAQLWLAVGEEDSASMTHDLAHFEDQLEAAPFPELTVISKRFPQRNHFDVLPEAFASGLRDLFGAASG